MNKSTFTKLVVTTCGVATLALGGIAVANAANTPFDPTQSPLVNTPEPLTSYNSDYGEDSYTVPFQHAYNAGASQRADDKYSNGNVTINEKAHSHYYVAFQMLGAVGPDKAKPDTYELSVFNYDTAQVLSCDSVTLKENPWTGDSINAKPGSVTGDCMYTATSEQLQKGSIDVTVNVTGESVPIARVQATPPHYATDSIEALIDHAGFASISKANDINVKDIKQIVSMRDRDNVYVPAFSVSDVDAFINEGNASSKPEPVPVPQPVDNPQPQPVSPQPRGPKLTDARPGGALDRPVLKIDDPGLASDYHAFTITYYRNALEQHPFDVTLEPHLIGTDHHYSAILWYPDNIQAFQHATTGAHWTFKDSDFAPISYKFANGLFRSQTPTQAEITLNKDSVPLGKNFYGLVRLTNADSHLTNSILPTDIHIQESHDYTQLDPQSTSPSRDDGGNSGSNCVRATQDMVRNINFRTFSSDDSELNKDMYLCVFQTKTLGRVTVQGSLNYTHPDHELYNRYYLNSVDTRGEGLMFQGSVTSTAPTITAEEQSVDVNGQIQPEQGLKGLPYDQTLYKVTVVTPADTSKPGKTEQVVKITFTDNTTQTVTVPVTVTGSVTRTDADNSNITTSDVTVHKGDTVDKSAGLSGVPEDATISVDNPADTSHAGSTQQTVIVHFKDGSTKQYTVNITVKDKIPASMITPVPSYDTKANVSTVTVIQNGTLKPTDGLKNIPDGANVTMVTPADTSKVGDAKQVVKMTFKDGSSVLITVPVVVKPTAADSYDDSNVKPVTAYKGDVIKSTDGLSNLPDGATVHVDTPADTSHAGKTQQVVTIHFKDGSSKQVTVNAMVKDKQVWVPIVPVATINTQDVTVHKGDTVKPDSGITNLPEGAKVVVVTPADTSKAGKTKQTVKVTFKDGSNRTVSVNITVLDKQSWATITPVPSSVTTTTVNVHKGDKLKPTDGLVGLPEGAKVTVVTPADTSEAGKTQQVVKIIFNDGSSRTVTVPVNISDKTPWTSISAVPSVAVSGVDVLHGAVVKDTAGLKNLPKDATVTVIKHADTSKIGKTQQVVKVTFKDGSSRTLTINVTVMPTLSDLYSDANVIPLTAHQGDKLKNTDGLKGLPEGTTVTVVKSADTSKVGDSKQVVKLSFTDGSSKTLTIPITVKPAVKPVAKPAVKPVVKPVAHAPQAPHQVPQAHPVLASTGANTALITMLTMGLLTLGGALMIGVAKRR